MTAFFFFGGLMLFAWFIYDVVFQHPEMFKKVLVWLLVVTVGALVFVTSYTAPSRLSAVLVNVWGFALLALPVWWCVQWVRQGYKGHQ